jgi:ribosomal protein S18 acetylase RimI-like enzyme
MSYKIRKAHPKDLEEIYRIGLLEESFAVSSETRFYGKKYLANWLKNQEDSILLVAESQRKIAGFIFVNIMFNKWAMIENLMVIESMRKQEVGTILLKEVQKRLKKKKINYMASWTRKENRVIQTFLRKHGFIKGYPFIWMEKADKPLWPEHKKDLLRFKSIKGD